MNSQPETSVVLQLIITSQRTQRQWDKSLSTMLSSLMNVRIIQLDMLTFTDWYNCAVMNDKTTASA